MKRHSMFTPPKTIMDRERLSERLRNRIAHNYNEMSPDEIRVHDCLVMDEFLTKNPDIKANLSEHRRFREALESREVRTTLVHIGSIFVGTPGYNWKVLVGLFIPHPINSTFHNAVILYRSNISQTLSVRSAERPREE